MVSRRPHRTRLESAKCGNMWRAGKVALADATPERDPGGRRARIETRERKRMQGQRNAGSAIRTRAHITWERASRATPRLTMLAVGAMLAATAVLAGCGGGGSKKATATSGTATVAATKTPAGTPTPGANAGLKTPIAISPGSVLATSDLDARGTGTASRGDFRGSHLVIPKINVNASFSVKSVGGDGQMPNPNGPEDVVYYDFSQWDGLGGLPGKGGNTVIAGHVDYINYGPAVFWNLHQLEAGDMVSVQLDDGTSVNYKIEFNKQIDVGDSTLDWSKIVQATADESITLITCGGDFEAGHYNMRQIIWGRRVV